MRHMKNNVLVTGLGIGVELDICGACNSDFSWLINNPSNLLWADKIYISSEIWKSANSEYYKNENKLQKAISLILNIVSSEGLIEIFNPSDIFSPSYKTLLDKKVDSDLDFLKKNSLIKYPDDENDHTFDINGQSYCIPQISTLYLSLDLADHLNANCLFDDKSLNYFSFMDQETKKIKQDYQYAHAFKDLINSKVPNQLIDHNYAFNSEKQCTSCQKESTCKDTYLIDIEKSTNSMLNYRNYDELHQLKNILEEIKKSANKSESINDLEDIKKVFEHKAKKINKNINKAFPRIERWSELITMVSIPTALISGATGNVGISVVSASLAATSKLSQSYISYYKNKHNWIGFFNKKPNISN